MTTTSATTTIAMILTPTSSSQSSSSSPSSLNIIHKRPTKKTDKQSFTSPKNFVSLFQNGNYDRVPYILIMTWYKKIEFQTPKNFSNSLFKVMMGKTFFKTSWADELIRCIEESLNQDVCSKLQGSSASPITRGREIFFQVAFSDTECLNNIDMWSSPSYGIGHYNTLFGITTQLLISTVLFE